MSIWRILVGVVLGVVVILVIVGKFQHRHPNADELQCSSNLKTLFVFGGLYAEKRDGYFPYDPDGKNASFQQLMDAFPDDLRPEHFVCPTGEETPAPRVDGRGTLTTGTCSYEAVPWRLKQNEKNAIVYYDKKPHHQRERQRGRMVASTDYKFIFMDEDTFQRRFEEQRVRFSVPTRDITPKRPK